MRLGNNISNLPDIIRYVFNNKFLFLKQERIPKDADLDLMYNIQPLFGFKSEETYWRLGDAYMTCIRVYSTPDSINRHWLWHIFKLDNVIATVDVRPLKTSDSKEAIKRQIDENLSRNDTNDILEYQEIQDNLKKYGNLLNGLRNNGDIMLALDIRLYVIGRSFYEMESQVERVEVELNDAEFYEYGRNLNEQYEEYQSLFVSPTFTQKTLSARQGIPVPSNVMAQSLPFHYNGWQDPNGFYLGDTENYNGYGTVFFDPFYIDKYLRTCYDAFITGVKGSGKSTIIKNIIENAVAMGNGARIIDVIGEFEEVVKNLGGIVIKFDSEGKNGILNLLEILRMDDNDTENYHIHISKLSHIYRLMVPECSKNEVDMFSTLLKKVYVKFGVIPSEDTKIFTNITGLEHTKYPIWSDLLDVIVEEINRVETENAVGKDFTVNILMSIKISVESLVKSYGAIFNGHTTIPNLENADVISYDISDIVGMDIFDMQLFNVLSMACDSCMKVGLEMKRLHDKQHVSNDKLKHHLIILDESYISINSDKPFAVKRIKEIMSMCRKFYIGVYLITPQISDICKSNASDVTMNEIKTLFESCQYKIIMRQDALTIDKIRSSFSSILTPMQIEQVPDLKKQELFLVLSSAQTIRMRMKDIPEHKLAYYGGGA